MPNVQQNVILAPFTTFHIGGPADYFITAHSKDELIEAIEMAQNKSLDFFVLGTGANILIGDKGFRGLVIKNEARKFEIAMETDELGESSVLLTAESGAIIEDLINFTSEKGLSGLEHYAGIPSSVGGAIWQNLHFLSPDRSRTIFISEILESAVIYPTSKSGSKEQVKKSDEKDSRVTSFSRAISVDQSYFRFGYDYSSLHDTQDIVLSASFRLASEDKKVIKQRIDANLRWRREKHPRNAVSCSAGSIFKKIEGYGAGRLIEKVGLKGKRVGNAQISERHANFFINTGGATAKDVRDLICLAESKVKNELDLDLQPEISFIGDF